MEVINYFTISFPASSRNESFARVVVAAFAAQLDPTLEELNEIKTAVSEAVTNAIIHGYRDRSGEVVIACSLRQDNSLEVIVKDTGTGIDNLEQAREPLYTSRPDLERSGMGFTVMEEFMDSVSIQTQPGQGTSVTMTKRISAGEQGGNGKN
ncbi:MAG: anti-sigma F factor [Eubacteriales bacterium]|jgi:stage II sporulation protein AB (anti-sigma F factor)|nr:anti-sigma F factor [Eubacteriales bacterium]MDD3073378.1 anti-sigma F factor [Eubacteriales bacterium]MDD4078740.1 anti-sigma F factor [Eubacteriales bacterium]MDD4768618.1 anti-sigma F factor [Eubacteriales bacterium]HCX79209.1 anti-sigma F factor [Bacillota bacterium]